MVSFLDNFRTNGAILEEKCCFLMVLPTRRKVEVLNLFMTIKYKERVILSSNKLLCLFLMSGMEGAFDLWVPIIFHKIWFEFSRISAKEWQKPPHPTHYMKTEGENQFWPFHRTCSEGDLDCDNLVGALSTWSSQFLKPCWVTLALCSLSCVGKPYQLEF